MYLAVLGNHPDLSLAELERTQKDATPHSPTTALFSDKPWSHLGGSSKIGRVIKRLPGAGFDEVIDYLYEQFPEDADLPDQKISLGLSIYGDKVPAYRKAVFSYKKRLRTLGYKPRFVLGEGQQLSSAQVLHNGLAHKGCEILVSFSGKEAVVARSIWVQDIDSYSYRDMERPYRDMEVGMLPPKLAQIMVNLAGGEFIYDPFCGSGVVLQEALLMDKRAAGSDIAEEMVAATRKNLKWLSEQYNTDAQVPLQTADARKLELPNGVDALVSEIYLGPVLNSQPGSQQLEKLADDASTLIEQSLSNWRPQLDTNARICLAVPAWKSQGSIVYPPLVTSIDELSRLGYNQVRFSHIKASDLVYRRPGQYVGRRLILLEKN